MVAHDGTSDDLARREQAAAANRLLFVLPEHLAIAVDHEAGARRVQQVGEACVRVEGSLIERHRCRRAGAVPLLASEECVAAVRDVLVILG